MAAKTPNTKRPPTIRNRLDSKRLVASITCARNEKSTAACGDTHPIEERWNVTETY